MLQDFFNISVFFRSFLGLWRTRLTESNKEDDREFQVKTTLRELIIYVAFIVILCICKYPSRCLPLVRLYGKC